MSAETPEVSPVDERPLEVLVPAGATITSTDVTELLGDGVLISIDRRDEVAIVRLLDPADPEAEAQLREAVADIVSRRVTPAAAAPLADLLADLREAVKQLHPSG